MNTHTTILDSYISTATRLLQQALNDGGKYDIPSKYINTFCEMVVNSMQRCVFNAIASCELYGDAWGFEFNLGGYIDTYYENDNMRWHGFSDEQVERLRRAYPDIVQLFRMVAWYIIGHECGSKMQTAEDMYNRFVERAREMMHYNENEE